MESDSHSRLNSDIEADSGEEEEQAQGSEDDGEDLMDNLSGCAAALAKLYEQHWHAAGNRKLSNRRCCATQHLASLLRVAERIIVITCCEHLFLICKLCA